MPRLSIIAGDFSSSKHLSTWQTSETTGPSRVRRVASFSALPRAFDARMTPERALSATSKALRACASGVDRATPLASALARPAFRAASALVAFWLAAFRVARPSRRRRRDARRRGRRDEESDDARARGGAGGAAAASREGGGGGGGGRRGRGRRVPTRNAKRPRRARRLDPPINVHDRGVTKRPQTLAREEKSSRAVRHGSRKDRAREGEGGGVETARGAATSDDAARNVFRFDASDIHKVF